MRVFMVISAIAALIFAVALADIAEAQQTDPETYGSGAHYGSGNSYGSGTDGHQMPGKKALDEDHKMGSKTVPVDGSILTSAPEFISLDFGHAMTLDAVFVSTLFGETRELDVSGVEATSHFMLKAPDLQPDDYVVDWRARGTDGHIMSGTFTFTVE